VRHQFASVHELARIELLAGLPGETLERLAGRMERRTVGAGEVLFESEDERGRFAVVVSGMLRARSGGIVRPGEALGGLTLFDEPIQAMVPSVVALCDQATFDELVRPALGR
jgi:CRP-like cAMP-binding protein